MATTAAIIAQHARVPLGEFRSQAGFVPVLITREWLKTITLLAQAIDDAGTVTAVTATIPLASSGGNTPDISMPGLNAWSGVGDSVRIAAGGVTWEWYTPTSGGLQYWVESENHTGQNATVSSSMFTPIPFGTDVNDADAIIHPLGAGALTAREADGTGTGGSKRGSYSVDFQLFGNAPDTIVAGNYSGWVAGANNKQNTGNYAFGGGGIGNVLTGGSSGIVGGSSNINSGGQSFIGGGGNIDLSGSYSGAVGQFHTAAADHAFHSGYLCTTSAGKVAPVAMGYFNSALSHYSSAWGAYANTRALIGCRAFGSLAPNGDGSGQQRDVVLYATTTGTGSITATSNGGGAASTSNQICIPANYVMACRAVVAFSDAAGNSGRFYIDAGIKNVAGVISLVGATTTSAFAGDATLNTCTATAVADNVNLGISFNVTGKAATNINWYIYVYCVEGLRA